jgi:inner membrane protein
MPSAFTHAVAGAAIASLAPSPYRSVRLSLVAALAAVAPDLDVIGFRFGVPYADALGHRGLSHSLGVALIAASAVWLWSTRQRARWSAASAALFVVLWLACASHGLLDACTDAGLGVGFFIPFDDRRYFLPWRPIRTSPLSVQEFFTGQGAAILSNEMRLVWLPSVLLIAGGALGRRLSRRRWLCT